MVMLVMILGATMLGVSTVAGFITVQKIRTATDITDSAKAIYAADAGIERCLYEKFGADAEPDATCNFAPGEIQLSNGAQVEVTETGNLVKSIGNASRSYRAFGIFLDVFNN
jgi:hypothetical protein